MTSVECKAQATGSNWLWTGWGKTRTSCILQDNRSRIRTESLSLAKDISSMKTAGRFLPAFDALPNDCYLEQWREFISSTGRPEDFENVSTTKPTQLENIVLLSEEIAVPTMLRPGGERVPCPFCAPGSPKFIRGRMAWFPDEAAVRFIGHQCAETHFGENYREAERAFRRQQKCREYLDLWQEIRRCRPSLVRFIEQVETVAADIQFARDQIDTQAPGFCDFLHRELAQSNGELFIDSDLGLTDRHGNAVVQRKSIGTAAGLSFLAPGYDAMRDIRNLKAALADTIRDLPEWEPTSPEHHATDEVLKRGRVVERAMRRMVETLLSVSDGQKFLEKRNLGRIHRWGNRPSSPFARFDLKLEDRQLLVRSNTFAGDHYANVLIADQVHEDLPSMPDPSITHIQQMVA